MQDNSARFESVFGESEEETKRMKKESIALCLCVMMLWNRVNRSASILLVPNVTWQRWKGGLFTVQNSMSNRKRSDNSLAKRIFISRRLQAFSDWSTPLNAKRRMNAPGFSVRMGMCVPACECVMKRSFFFRFFFPWLKRFMWSICRSHKRLPCTLLVAAVFFSRFHLRLRAFYTRINMLLLLECHFAKDAARTHETLKSVHIAKHHWHTILYARVCLIRIDEFLNSNRWFFCPFYLTKLIHSTLGALLFSSFVRSFVSLFAFVPLFMYGVGNGVRRFVCICCEANDVICLPSDRFEREKRKTHK